MENAGDVQRNLLRVLPSHHHKLYLPGQQEQEAECPAPSSVSGFLQAMHS